MIHVFSILAWMCFLTIGIACVGGAVQWQGKRVLVGWLLINAGLFVGFLGIYGLWWIDKGCK